MEEKQRGAEVLVETAAKAAGVACVCIHAWTEAKVLTATCTARGRRTTAAEPDFAHFAEFEAAPAPARRTAAATVAEADRDSMVCKIQTDRIYVVAAIVPQETV